MNYDNEIKYETKTAYSSLKIFITIPPRIILLFTTGSSRSLLLQNCKKSNNNKRKYFESEQNVPSTKQTDRARFCSNENRFRGRFKMEKEKKKIGKILFFVSIKDPGTETIAEECFGSKIFAFPKLEANSCEEIYQKLI